MGDRLRTRGGRLLFSYGSLLNLMALTMTQVGWMMTRSVVDINWSYAGDSLPAFVTLIFIPFSYSIAYGLVA
jgi:xanthine/uracil/vitamin C permease (AzgA family)